ncbi:ammonium transporter [Chloroflexota bacterium]
MNYADTAWLLTSSAMVLLMTPGLALFYGGMVRRKNLLSTMMMSFAPMGLIGVLWAVYGYSLSFGTGNGFIGSLEYLWLAGVGQPPSELYASTVPHLLFMTFQGMFAIITVAIISGAVVERIKFGALMLFSAIWLTIVYAPIAHWVWGDGGWLLNLGALDFAGGTVVHICAGFSALALAMVLGPRRGFSEGAVMLPNNIPLVALGAGILWFGWFGFNAGSALAADGIAVNAFVATNIAAATGALTWTVLSGMQHRPSLLGLATGAVAGLVAITPAAGFVSPIMGIFFGIGGSMVGYYCIQLRTKWGIDESLDVWGIHGMGGLFGALATGVFASTAVNPAGADGLIYGNPAQMWPQIIGILAVAAFSFGVTWLVGKAIQAIMGLRVSQPEEIVGLDVSQHGENAYGGVLR